MNILLAVITSGLLSTILTLIVEAVKEHKKTDDASTEGIKYCLLHSLQQEGRMLVESGHVTQLQHQQFEAMYQTYKNLHGDGYADKIKEEVGRLPIKYL